MLWGEIQSITNLLLGSVIEENELSPSCDIVDIGDNGPPNLGISL